MEEKITINGINGATGDYLVPPMDLNYAAGLIKGDEQPPKLLTFLKAIWHTISQPHLGLPLDVDPADVTRAGWAVVFHEDESDAVKKALEPLIEHRRREIGDDTIVKVLDYKKQDESMAAWLARHGVGQGNVIPANIPYYVLLVGGPDRIPFDFGQHLDVEYAVGRLHFDKAEDYSTYAQSLIDYETGDLVPNAKEVAFFAPRHEFDRATQLSADLLVNPLADGIPAASVQPEQPGVAQRWGFRPQKLWGDAATENGPGRNARSQRWGQRRRRIFFRQVMESDGRKARQAKSQSKAPCCARNGRALVKYLRITILPPLIFPLTQNYTG